MRKKILLLPAILFCLGFAGCKKDSAAGTPTASASAATSFISAGTWNITSFTEKSEDKTSDFSGMNFTFSADGKVAVSGSKSASGTWGYSPPVAGYYGGPASLATFTLNIVDGSSFTKLSKAWNVNTSAASSLKLDDHEPLEDEHVTFTKE